MLFGTGVLQCDIGIESERFGVSTSSLHISAQAQAPASLTAVPAACSIQHLNKKIAWAVLSDRFYSWLSAPEAPRTSQAARHSFGAMAFSKLHQQSASQTKMELLAAQAQKIAEASRKGMSWGVNVHFCPGVSSGNID